MAGLAFDPLLEVLRNPHRMTELSPLQWTEMMRRTRRNGLIGRLASYAAELGIIDELPPAVQRQIRSVAVLVASNHRMLIWEMDRIKRALKGIDAPVVMLKGAAYVLGEHRLAEGRVCSDIDIMVRREDLETVEKALQDYGWIGGEPGTYNDRYYRKWMHEIPPMRHRERLTVVDLHHNILPLTARIQINASAFIDRSRPSPEPRFLIFAPVDLVIHAAVHMMYDGDLNERLRDLLDIHEMLIEFSEDPAFFTELMSRARRRRVQRPVFYALYFSAKLLGTSIPPALWNEGAGGRPNALILSIMSRIVPHALMPDLPDKKPSRKVRRARFLLFIRSHWLRMPPFMLLRHLAIKAVMGMLPNKNQ